MFENQDDTTMGFCEVKPKKHLLSDINNKEKVMATITKKKLIQVISQKQGLHPNEVRNVIQSFLDTMTDCLAEGDRLEFRDFGVFEVVRRKQKIGRNPKNAGVPIVIPSRSAVKFTPGKKMKEVIEGENSPSNPNQLSSF